MTRVAIFSAGLGSVKRGYETHQKLLFKKLSQEPEYEVDLIMGRGKSSKNCHSMHSYSRNSWLATALGKISESSSYWEKVMFSLHFILFQLVFRKRYDAFLIIEPATHRILSKFKWLLWGEPKFIYTHGIGDEPMHYFWFAKNIIEINIENYRAAVESNSGDKNVFLIPHFLDIEIDASKSAEQRDEAKRNLGLENKKVVLAVGIIEKNIKRVDYIVEEMASLDDSWCLVLVGKVIDAGLLETAKNKLGSRVMQMELDNSEMSKAYNCADVFVMASYNEGFPYVILEAMAYRLPIVLPDTDKYAWILKGDLDCIDMKTSGVLARHLDSNFSIPWFEKVGQQNHRVYKENYTWDEVKPLYFNAISKSALPD